MTCLAFGIGIGLLTHVIAEVKNQEYNVSYFSNGEAITLKCRCKVSFWSGPVVTNVENGTSPIMITDIYGQYQVLNVSIYFHSDKPSVTINVSSNLTMVEGEFARICCTSVSNPRPTFISWHKENTKLVSTFKNSSLCYKMSNVSRLDTGNYVCSTRNEIGNASSEISLIISSENTIQTVDQNDDASPHYAEIPLEDIILTPSQGNHTQSITTSPSDVRSASSSNNDTNTLENVDDGYEQPYTTLGSNVEVEVARVNHKTKQNMAYQNLTPSKHECFGHSVECCNVYANESQESANIRYGENHAKETDDIHRSNVHKQNDTKEYINLLLKQ
ncbi:unnamed protein product [Mytilus edulis]|uniref:Ig-like domain-containing protein n=1 Tax=Mytilus edulis TaxID=6550 RepID=A0A8S3R2Y4_MYTED|nr:unnamed protein product [Mytilus edulis]